MPHVPLSIVGLVSLFLVTSTPIPLTNYTSVKGSFTVQFPRSWRQLSTKGLDLSLSSPDSAAFVTIQAQPPDGTHLTPAQIVQEQAAVLYTMGGNGVKIKQYPLKSHGVVFQVSSATVKLHGLPTGVMLVDSEVKGRFYDINAGVTLNLPGSRQDNDQALHIVNSLVIINH